MQKTEKSQNINGLSTAVLLLASLTGGPSYLANKVADARPVSSTSTNFSLDMVQSLKKLKTEAKGSETNLRLKGSLSLLFTSPQKEFQISEKERNALATLAERISNRELLPKTISHLTKQQLDAAISFFSQISKAPSLKKPVTLSPSVTPEDIGTFLHIANSDGQLWSPPLTGRMQGRGNHGAILVAYTGDGDEEDKNTNEDIAKKLAPPTEGERIRNLIEDSKRKPTLVPPKTESTLEAAAPPAHSPPVAPTKPFHSPMPFQEKITTEERIGAEDTAVYPMAEFRLTGNPENMMKMYIAGITLRQLGGGRKTHDALGQLLQEAPVSGKGQTYKGTVDGILDLSDRLNDKGILGSWDDQPVADTLADVVQKAVDAKINKAVTPSINKAANAVKVHPLVGGTVLLATAFRDYLNNEDKADAAWQFRQKMGISVEDLKKPEFAGLIHSIGTELFIENKRSANVHTFVRLLNMKGGNLTSDPKSGPVNLADADPSRHFALKFPEFGVQREKNSLKFRLGVKSPEIYAQIERDNKIASLFDEHPELFGILGKLSKPEDLFKFGQDLEKSINEAHQELKEDEESLSAEEKKKKEAEAKERRAERAAAYADAGDLFRAIGMLAGKNKGLATSASIVSAGFDISSKLMQGSFGGAALVFTSLLQNLLGLGPQDLTPKILEEVQKLRAEVLGYHNASRNRDERAARQASRDFAQLMEKLDLLDAKLTASHQESLMQLEQQEQKTDEGIFQLREKRAEDKLNALRSSINLLEKNCRDMECDNFFSPTHLNDQGGNKTYHSKFKDAYKSFTQDADLISDPVNLAMGLPPDVTIAPARLTNEPIYLSSDYEVRQVFRHARKFKSISANSTEMGLMAKDLATFGISIVPDEIHAKQLEGVSFPLNLDLYTKAAGVFRSEMERGRKISEDPNGHLSYTADHSPATFKNKVRDYEDTKCEADPQLTELGQFIDAGKLQLEAFKRIMPEDPHGRLGLGNLLKVLAQNDAYIENLPHMLGPKEGAIIKDSKFRGFDVAREMRAQPVPPEAIESALKQFQSGKDRNSYIIPPCDEEAALDSAGDSLSGNEIRLRDETSARQFIAKYVSADLLKAAYLTNSRIRFCYGDPGYTSDQVLLKGLEENKVKHFIADYLGVPRFRIKVVVDQPNGHNLLASDSDIVHAAHPKVHFYGKRFLPSWGESEKNNLLRLGRLFTDKVSDPYQNILKSLNDWATEQTPKMGTFNGWSAAGELIHPSAKPWDDRYRNVENVFLAGENDIASKTQSSVIQVRDNLAGNESIREVQRQFTDQAENILTIKRFEEIQKELKKLGSDTGRVVQDLTRLDGAKKRVEFLLWLRLGDRIYSPAFQKALGQIPTKNLVIQKLNLAARELGKDASYPKIVAKVMKELEEGNQEFVKFLLTDDSLKSAVVHGEMEQRIHDLEVTYAHEAKLRQQRGLCVAPRIDFNNAQQLNDEERKAELEARAAEAGKNNAVNEFVLQALAPPPPENFKQISERVIPASYISVGSYSDATEYHPGELKKVNYKPAQRKRPHPPSITELKRLIDYVQIMNPGKEGEWQSKLNSASDSYRELVSGIEKSIPLTSDTPAKELAFSLLKEMGTKNPPDGSTIQELMNSVNSQVEFENIHGKADPLAILRATVATYAQANEGENPLAKLRMDSKVAARKSAIKSFEESYSSLTRLLKLVREDQAEIQRLADTVANARKTANDRYGLGEKQVMDSMIRVTQELKDRLELQIKQRERFLQKPAEVSTEDIEAMAKVSLSVVSHKNVPYLRVDNQANGGVQGEHDFVGETLSQYEQMSTTAKTFAKMAAERAERDAPYWKKEDRKATRWEKYDASPMRFGGK
jgi:hypothetical protein